MSKSYRVVRYGVGPIGQSCLLTIISKHPFLELVGAIDIDPDKARKDDGMITGLGQNAEVLVSADAETVVSASKPTSFMPKCAQSTQLSPGHLHDVPQR